MRCACQDWRDDNSWADHAEVGFPIIRSKLARCEMDIGGWLRGLGLAQYEAAFCENEIDEGVLHHLTAEDLKDLGVTAVGHRRKLLAAIAASETLVPSEAVPDPLTPLAPSKSLQLSAERRPITVMFCDLVGSTSLAAKLDAEDWRDLVGAYLDASSAAVERFGGHVLKKLGDGLMALFGYPRAQENDAERAVRAALAIQRALEELNVSNAAKGAPKLIARIGLELGPVVVDGNGEVFGDAPNVAARVQGAAEPGTVLVTASVHRQIAGLFVVEDKGAHALKGVPAAVALYRIVRASGGGRRSGARSVTPFIGREEDLALLMRRWERACGGEGQFAQIVGEPGLGKSRLLDEFRARVGATPHTWVEWSSSQLLQNTPLHPLVEWGRLRFGGADVAAEKRLADLEQALEQVRLDPGEHTALLAPVLGIPLPESRAAKLAPEELRRRQLAALTAWILAGARTQPIVLAFEDLHWADPTSLDLLKTLAERGAAAPLFILATARPEFRAPWATRSHHGVVSLVPLDRDEIRRMVGAIAERHALAKESVEGVADRTSGVPLFVEEVTRLLLEGGAQMIPPTLQQSLAARLDRLGEAREVAQIGAVLGREFSYGLLRRVAATASVAAVADRALQSALDRLAEADLLFVEGIGPEAIYRFKHALIQDAAYESLLKSRRQDLHRRAAGALLAVPDPQPELVAHHFTQAGETEPAIEWWGKAGDAALRRSAFQEAIAHLGKAIAMADNAGSVTAPTASRNRLKLQTDYGCAVMWSRGYGADETEVAFARAGELAARTGEPSQRFAAYYADCARSLVRGELRASRETAEAFLSQAEEEGRAAESVAARRMLGTIRLFQGELGDASALFQRVLADYAPDPELRYGTDAGISAESHLALAEWHLGELQPARERIQRAIENANRLGHSPTTAHAHFSHVFMEAWPDPKALERASTTLLKFAQMSGLSYFAASAEIFRRWAECQLNASDDRRSSLRLALMSYIEQGSKLFAPRYYGFLAEAEAQTQSAEGALALIDEGLSLADSTGEHLWDPHLFRVRANILLKRDPADPALAEEAYRKSIAIAKEQGARSYQLIASLSLAKLYQSTARPLEAHAILAPALEGFSPTPEMPEIADAQALLAALAETDAVKGEAARRERRGQLQVAYGNALFQARGYGVPETAQAFARAREEAQGEKDAPQRLAADYGLWAGSYVRGELSPMRTHAEAFLSDVEAKPDSPEAGVAHRAAGTTHWFAGEYREAQEHLERALALFQPGRDDDLAFRFGHDPGVSAMVYLALTLWPLGDIERAVSLVGDAEVRLAGLAHIGTRANAKCHLALFELMRGDLTRFETHAAELAALTRDHDLPLWRVVGIFFDGLSTAQNGALSSGLEIMRRGVELLREHVLLCDGLVKIALAEAEGRAGNVDRTVAVLDEALATCDRTGHRAFEAELHRARGEMLLKRGTTNLAIAEEALQTAIAVAKRQATRSFELRAALALAKLYQSTGRPAEAHDALAQALEGFAPTPEMPEIAEAEALLGEFSNAPVGALIR
jgi:class 3 adenylate cyclase/predicted ATPase